MKLTVSVSIRSRSGRFPSGSHARVLRKVKPALERDTQRAFDEQIDPKTGKPWPPRKVQPGTKKPTNPLLVLSGRLKKESMKAVRAAAVSGTTLYVRQRLTKYGKYHQEGTTRIARRRFQAASPATIAKLRRELGQAGLRIFRNERVN